MGEGVGLIHWTEMSRETFARIATRGVVQLFNAVRDQQKEVKTQLKQAGGSFRKRENVLKNINKDNFINLLSGKAMDKVEEPAEKRSRMERRWRRWRTVSRAAGTFSEMTSCLVLR